MRWEEFGCYWWFMQERVCVWGHVQQVQGLWLVLAIEGQHSHQDWAAISASCLQTIGMFAVDTVVIHRRLRRVQQDLYGSCECRLDDWCMLLAQYDAGTVLAACISNHTGRVSGTLLPCTQTAEAVTVSRHDHVPSQLDGKKCRAARLYVI
jgi:hypothetical protein